MYERGLCGAQVVIVDNGSEPKHAALIEQMARRMGGEYIRNETNAGFSEANNQGLAHAAGRIVVFMNNDVECSPGFLDRVTNDVKPGALYGPSLLAKHGWDYLEGWCIAGMRDDWLRIGGWDDQYYQGLYWEDNDLCFRAQYAGLRLVKTIWPVWHFNNYTSDKLPGAKMYSGENERRFIERIKSWST